MYSWGSALRGHGGWFNQPSTRPFPPSSSSNACAKDHNSLQPHITWWVVFVSASNDTSFSNFCQSWKTWQMNSGACLCLCTPLKESNLHWCLQAAMCNKWHLTEFPKPAVSHLTLLHLKYGHATVYDADLVAVNFTGAVKLMDCVIFVGIMNYPGGCQTRRSLISNKQTTC